MTIADTLREARRRIEEPEKWGKGREVTVEETKECPVVAIHRISQDEFVVRQCWDFYSKAIESTSTIGSWNDAPERTHAEVLAAFDRAIALAESAEEKT